MINHRYSFVLIVRRSCPIIN